MNLFGIHIQNSVIRINFNQ